nr:uncharacterized protein LOC107395320 [Nothobranchius furzeri]XP_054592609.1 uncharacterized protein LOC107395320 [Nothobranchius furzeri]
MENPQDGGASSSPRPKRERKLPGYLVDYEHNLTEPPNPSRAPSSSSSSDNEEEGRWQRMESAWNSVLQTMNHLQASMEDTHGTLLKRVERLEQASQPSSEVIHRTIEPLPVPEQDTTTPANMLTPVKASAPSPPRKVSFHTQPVLHPATYVAASTPLRRLGRCTATPFVYQRSEHHLLINRPGQVQISHHTASANQPRQRDYHAVQQLSQAGDPVSLQQTLHPAAPVFQARPPANPVYLQQPPRPADPTYQLPRPPEPVTQPSQWADAQHPVSNILHPEALPDPAGNHHVPDPSGSDHSSSSSAGQYNPRVATSESARAPLPNLMEMMVASSYGIPKPRLVVFRTGRESDFALLKKGLDSTLGPHSHLGEDYKFQVLLDHLEYPSALQVAKRYIHDRTPYTSAMRALEQRYGQPRQLVQSELSTILNCPPIRTGDSQAIEDLSLSVSSLVGLLSTMDEVAASELHCGSHVDRLLTKLPLNYRDSFIEYCITRGIIRTGSSRTYNMYDFSEWLERKSQVLQLSRQASHMPSDRPRPEKNLLKALAGPKSHSKSASIYYGPNPAQAKLRPGGGSTAPNPTVQPKKRQKFKPYCPYCEGTEHYLNGCDGFKGLDLKAMATWITEKAKCWRCGRKHSPEQCTLKKPCSTCGDQHLSVLHDLVEAKKRDPNILTVSTSMVYLDYSSHSGRVMLKVVPIQLHHGGKSLDTFAVLDDGSEKTVVLPAAVESLGLEQEEATLALRTIRRDVIQMKGGFVSFQVSPRAKPKVRYKVTHAFTADQLSLATQSCPAEQLKKKYIHLQKVQIKGFNQVQPLVLLGSDNAHLITPVRPVLRGSSKGPVAVCTKLGWAIQGPASSMPTSEGELQCLNMCLSPAEALHQDVKRLWQLDVPPYRTEKEVTRSKEDREAVAMLETKTLRVPVDGVERYATPLLRRRDFPRLCVSPEAVKGLLRSTERKLAKNPDLTHTYNQEIHRLVESGYVAKLSPDETHSSSESWYVPHHIVHHNNKARVVFNCSFEFQGSVLNRCLLPGPPMGPTLLGVLLRFRQHPVAVSGDIKAMFHQVRLLPEDCPLLRFLWRDCETDRPPDIYEWRVLPFGTTCSPCCATFALQRHAREHKETHKDICDSVHTAFYVDNCLQSLFNPEEAKQLIDRMRDLLIQGGFDIRQWASNVPEVVAHLPASARSESCELWLNFKGLDSQESTLGLSWHCPTNVLGYKHRPITYSTVTLRNVYKVLATQYDPLGYICPYTTRAKLIVQALWSTERGWDEPIEGNLLQSWLEWEGELSHLQHVIIPRCYAPPHNSSNVTYEAHVFCDASEKAYGAVAYLRVIERQRPIITSFLMARSRVAPRKQVSMPRLELCAALTGAQLARLLQTELTVPIQSIYLWTDSTTVLQWIQSSSCRYKVFVGTRICEIQELTSPEQWRYVTSELNPADDITRGKHLADLTAPNRWSHGPPFLLQAADTWPKLPTVFPACNEAELRRTAFCGHASVSPTLPDPMQYASLDKLIAATYRTLHGAADTPITAAEQLETKTMLLRSAQTDSFTEETKALQTSRPVRSDSRLSTLSPEYDSLTGLIRVGGRLRQAADLDPDSIHPIVLAAEHPLTKLIIRTYDDQLLHPGAERLFAEIRRTYWILRGRQAIKKHQHQCVDCRRWRATPSTPKMADLPSSRMRLYKPPFWSTGVDCFGPYTIKIGRRREKRWGIIYKCLTTRCVHLDLLPSLDTDSFLMSLRRFIARRGKPYEMWSDQGTNFRGGHRELQAAFENMEPDLKQQLATQAINFCFNPPHSPHFGGAWEREIRAVKSALQVVLKDQVVAEEVLLTALIEVEGILNSKPLGYASADIADPDPITPNLLLMGRRDSALPQAVYGPSGTLSTRRWIHSQVISDHFWKRFIQNYLPGLQLRQKWRKSTDNMTVGQAVMIVDSNLPRGLWPVGTISQVFPGTDGVVRAAEVKVKDSLYVRPVTKLVGLPKVPEDLDDTVPQ